MSQKTQNAIGLYNEGINQGHAKEALNKYIGARYTQHSAGVADGKEGFLEFFIPFLQRNPVRDIQLVRTIEDGNFVFTHAHQNLNNGRFYYVTADFFDTDSDDKIIEHWDVIQEEKRETASGRSMVDGPTEVEDLDKTEENRTLVQGFFDEVLIGGNFQHIEDYISATEYAQHSPVVEDGIRGFQKFLITLAEQGSSMQYQKLHRLVVEGNFAASLSHVKMNEEDWCIIDVFRVQQGKIVEHWNVQEKMGPKDTWNNSGKF